MPTCEICSSQKTHFFYKLNNYSYFLCQNCKTLFLSPIPSQHQVIKYYSKDFHYTAGEQNEKLIRKRANKILLNLKSIYPKGRTLLDIGSGYGFFLDEAKKNGLNILGIEPSKNLYKNSITQLIKFTENTTFEEFYTTNKNKKFDFITIIHTIEHIPDPQSFLKKAVQLLNPEGVIYLETPNLNSHLFYTEKYDYTFLTPPDHIWIFSFKSFAQILKRLKGIQIIKKSTYSQSEHFMGILKKKLEVRSDKLEAKNESKKMPFKSSNIQPPTSNISRLKYLVFDRLLAPIFTPILNIGGYGSILELYIRKK